MDKPSGICQICLEYREEENDPTAICGYCACDIRNKESRERYLYSEVENLGLAIKSSSVMEIADILRIAEKMNRGECGYDRADLYEAIGKYKDDSGVYLYPEEWGTILKILASKDRLDLHNKIKEQLDK